jgi:hypothetical protein
MLMVYMLCNFRYICTCIDILRITGSFIFVHRPVFLKLENTTFRKLDLFLSSGQGDDTYSVGSLRKS